MQDSEGEIHSLQFIDENGEEIEGPARPGELVYRGPNVMMGYALTRADLVAAKTAMANDLSAAAVRDVELEDVTLRGGFASKAKPWINPGWLNLGAQLTSSPSAKVRDLARRTLRPEQTIR